MLVKTPFLRHQLSTSLRRLRHLHSSPTSPASVVSAHATSTTMAGYHDFIRYSLSEGRTGRVSLKAPKVIGAAVSRGTRDYQEDAHTVTAVHIPPAELRHSLVRYFGLNWDPGHIGETLAGQVLFAGIYDGHGGNAVSGYLQQQLHALFEQVDPSEVPELVSKLQGVGGYFKRFKGGALVDWIKPADPPRTLDLEARATLAFLAADKRISELRESEQCGATASVALLQSLDPTAPFFATQDLALTVAHCGDTHVLLCGAGSARAYPMTEAHHADTREEQARLRRMGQGIVTDSFGEARYMGALANTRGFGDTKYKYFGMTPEPEIRTRRLKGRTWSSLILLSDGITSVLSDEEIVDLARQAPSPQRAAENVMSFAETIGLSDNATVIVIPLAGWGDVRGPDLTRDLREYRRVQAENSFREARSNR